MDDNLLIVYIFLLVCGSYTSVESVLFLFQLHNISRLFIMKLFYNIITPLIGYGLSSIHCPYSHNRMVWEKSPCIHFEIICTNDYQVLICGCYCIGWCYSLFVICNIILWMGKIIESRVVFQDYYMKTSPFILWIISMYLFICHSSVVIELPVNIFYSHGSNNGIIVHIPCINTHPLLLIWKTWYSLYFWASNPLFIITLLLLRWYKH